MTALKNEWFMFVQMAFWSQKVFGAFEKHTWSVNPCPFSDFQMKIVNILPLF